MPSRTKDEPLADGHISTLVPAGPAGLFRLTLSAWFSGEEVVANLDHVPGMGIDIEPHELWVSRDEVSLFRSFFRMKEKKAPRGQGKPNGTSNADSPQPESGCEGPRISVFLTVHDPPHQKPRKVKTTCNG